MVLFLKGAIFFQTTIVFFWLLAAIALSSAPPFYSRSCFHLANPDIVKTHVNGPPWTYQKNFSINDVSLHKVTSPHHFFFKKMLLHVTESPNASLRPLEFLPWNTNYSLGKNVLYCWSTPMFYPLFFLGTRHFHSSVFPPQSIYLPVRKFSTWMIEGSQDSWMDTTLLVYLPLNGYKIAEDLSNKENLLTSPCE